MNLGFLIHRRMASVCNILTSTVPPDIHVLQKMSNLHHACLPPMTSCVPRLAFASANFQHANLARRIRTHQCFEYINSKMWLQRRKWYKYRYTRYTHYCQVAAIGPLNRAFDLMLNQRVYITQPEHLRIDGFAQGSNSSNVEAEVGPALGLSNYLTTRLLFTPHDLNICLVVNICFLNCNLYFLCSMNALICRANKDSSEYEYSLRLGLYVKHCVPSPFQLPALKLHLALLSSRLGLQVGWMIKST